MKKSTFKNYIQNFQFRELFIDLGWNHINREPHPVRVGEELFQLEPITEKEGFHILLCTHNEAGEIPIYAVRKKMETRITKLYREHLIIFVNRAGTEQLWQWMIRKPNQPARISDTRWIKGQSPELLYQKASGLFFSLDEEDEITIVDVKERVAKNFDKNNEKVTKKFYTKFKKQHNKFLKFINGIEKKTDRDWYASLMLNRLMFCYFIQKKGFLDGDFNYLQSKLKACQEKKGEDEFYNFYRDFLLALFHEGLGAPVQSVSTDIDLGTIPYLNGGLFDEHDLERSYDIHIDDDAFESIFNFFDKWEWHLDTSHGATGKEINPDVIGYIFEKYINDRADMGAYYTKEDITDYISKNSILPYLFDETERHYDTAFNTDGPIWEMLKNSGDKYIYDAVKHGLPKDEENEEVLNWKHVENWWESSVFEDLDDDLKAGLNPDQEDLVDIREAWNTSAPEEVALPTEIWREVIERRKRYVEVRQAIENGEITKINDLITYNLDIRQFVQDVVENIDDQKFILHFYKSMAGDGKNRNPVSILDPTCGSGAFLFAGLNILEPLYETCLLRMRSYIAEEDQLNAEDESKFRNQYIFFREVLEEVQSEYHPNQEYFIYKSIILRNLYGVDIMREAVEIAKLRLFLKMVATVDVDTSKENLGLEPLPDIDFNIRVGNTLVGIGTEQEIDTLYDGVFDFDNSKGAVEEQCDMVSKAFNHYKQIQLTYGEDFESFKQAKKDLADRLADLRGKLDEMLKKRHYPGKDLEAWKESHQPFHWYAEFYDIIHDRGGFDVIIGNPPYVEYSKVKKEYKINGYNTEKCGNLYAFVSERSFDLLKNNDGFFGMIIPLSSICTDRAKSFQKLTEKRSLFLSHYSGDRNPSEMFEGVKMRLTILLAKETEKREYSYSTRYNKWYTALRPYMIDNLKYQETTENEVPSIPKLGGNLAKGITQKIKNAHDSKINFKKKTGKDFYYHDAPIHWVRAFSFAPYFYRDRDGVGVSSHYKNFYYIDDERTLSAVSLLNSSLFYFFFVVNSNCRDLSTREIERVSFDYENDKLNKKLNILCDKLMSFYKTVSKIITVNYKTTGTVKYEQIDTKQGKHIIDEIDKLLAVSYKLNPEELDYIINYDIKYRLGPELEDE
ncbi:MAG: Eco57I restriction-modification methylase domain-containing protein [Balneola sp.]